MFLGVLNGEKWHGKKFIWQVISIFLAFSGIIILLMVNASIAKENIILCLFVALSFSGYLFIAKKIKNTYGKNNSKEILVFFKISLIISFWTCGIMLFVAILFLFPTSDWFIERFNLVDITKYKTILQSDTKEWVFLFFSGLFVLVPTALITCGAFLTERIGCIGLTQFLDPGCAIILGMIIGETFNYDSLPLYVLIFRLLFT
jgi:hypothetical protein